jgi:hypothetical protein
MDVSASPVRRCVAVAGHGKRCQQSPFRGSPYCWHHLQSRKVPAPSRPLRVAPQPPAAVTALPVVDRMALAVRLAHSLGANELAELVTFIEDRRDGTLVLVKTDGRVDDARAHRPARIDTVSGT